MKVKVMNHAETLAKAPILSKEVLKPPFTIEMKRRLLQIFRWNMNGKWPWLKKGDFISFRMIFIGVTNIKPNFSKLLLIKLSNWSNQSLTQ